MLSWVRGLSYVSILFTKKGRAWQDTYNNNLQSIHTYELAEYHKNPDD